LPPRRKLDSLLHNKDCSAKSPIANKKPHRQQKTPSPTKNPIANKKPGTMAGFSHYNLFNDGD
jgi:hypothetical protein